MGMCGSTSSQGKDSVVSYESSLCVVNERPKRRMATMTQKRGEGSMIGRSAQITLREISISGKNSALQMRKNWRIL